MNEQATRRNKPTSLKGNGIQQAASQAHEYIVMTPYPIEPGHTLISVTRFKADDMKAECRSNAAYVAEGDNSGIIINKPASVMDYNRIQTQAVRDHKVKAMSAKMSFKVFLINSETNRISPEQRTLRFWIDFNRQLPSSSINSSFCTRSNQQHANNSIASLTNLSSTSRSSSLNFSNAKTTDLDAVGDDDDCENDHNDCDADNVKINESIEKNESDTENQEASNVDLNKSFSQFKSDCSNIAQAYFRQLIGLNPNDDFPKKYGVFIMKLMQLLKRKEFWKIYKMEIELRQLSLEDEPSSRASSIDSGGQADSDSGRGSPLTSQRILDIVESSYPNSISIQEICSTAHASEDVIRQFIDELTSKEKIDTTDGGKHYTRITRTTNDVKVNLVKQMPKVTKSKQPVIAIITAQFCEKLAVDAMISDKETFVKYRTTTTEGGESANYVYTLGNIGDHRVVSTKLTLVGYSRAASIAAGNATTRLLGTFPEIEYVFLVGCGGGVANYSNFETHVRLGDVVISSLPESLDSLQQRAAVMSMSSLSIHHNNKQTKSKDFVYVNCKQVQQYNQTASKINPDKQNNNNNILSVNTKTTNNAKNNNVEQQQQFDSSLNQEQKPVEFDDCQFRLWTPTRFELQELAKKLWFEGLENPKHRIWEYYIDEGIKSLNQQQEVDANRPPTNTDKLFMSIGNRDAIEVNHPEPADDEIDLRKDGKPMCHFGPIGSGKPATHDEQLKQSMVSEFGLRAFDAEFDPVIESIHGNRKENYIIIRGISDYKEGRKKRDWQQYSALVAAAFMKSLIVNLKPIS